MSAIVLCVTLNETKQFADTLERVETCGLAEHVHTAECYDADGVVVCGLEAHEHTDACYQARLQKDQPEQEVEEEPVADLPEPSGETVSDSAESTEPDPDAEALSGESVPTYEYTVGDRYPIYAEDIIAHFALPIDPDAKYEVGQVVDDAHPEGMLRVETDEKGIAIYPNVSFSRVELAFMCGDDIYIVDLLDAVVPETAPTTDPTKEPASETTEEPAAEPSDDPTEGSSDEPTEEPSDEPSEEPSTGPSDEPTEKPTSDTTEEPSDKPTEEPSSETTEEPTAVPPDAETTEAPSDNALYRVSIDLSEAEAPFSLVEWVAQALAGDGDAEDSTLTEEAAPLPVGEWTITYDEAVIAVEPVDGDYFVTPLCDFAGTTISVDTGVAACEITLLNWVADEDEPGEQEADTPGALLVPVEGADYVLSIDVPEEALLPATAVFKARAVEDDAYNSAALAAVAGENTEGYVVLAMFDLTIYDGEKVIQPKAALRIRVKFDASEASALPPAEDLRVFAVHFPGTGAQPEAAEVSSALDRKTAALNPKKNLPVRQTKTAVETIEAEKSGNTVSFSADSFSLYSVLAEARMEDLSGKTGVTNQDNVPVYSGHNLIFNTQVDTIAEKGTSVTLLGATEGSLNLSSWYQIEYDGKTGYVERKYIDIVEAPEQLEAESDAFSADISCEAGVLPEGTALTIGEPTLNGDEDAAVLALLNRLSADKQFRIRDIRYLDLSFMHEDAEIEPDGAVSVSLSLKQPMSVAENEALYLVHFAASGLEVLEDARFSIEDGALSGVDFNVDHFSTFAIVKVIEATVVTYDGKTYRVRVLYGPEAEIPDGSHLEATEILEDSDLYEAHVAQSAEAVGGTTEALNHIRLFDIAIIAPDGSKATPVAPVQVVIEYVSPVAIDIAQTVRIVHFGETATEVITPATNRDDAGMVDEFSFETGSFSIYGVVFIEKDEDSFVFEDEDFIVTVSYTKEANIPIGTRMTVRQVEFDTDEYWTLWNQTIEKLNEGVEWCSDGDEPDPRRGLADAAFFDVSFDYEGEPIEPDVPVQVDIRYKKYGIIAPAGETAGAVHIDGNTVELIDDVEVVYGECDPETQAFYVGGASEAQQYTYEQQHFSITGNYVTDEYIDQDAPVFYTSSPVLANPGALKAQLEAERQALAAAGLLGATGDSEAPKPASNKKLTSNGDGTYTLSLSVTGKADTGTDVEVEKSNVVIVMDRSNSMKNNNTYVYSEYVYSAATYNSRTYYYRKNGTNYYRVYYRNGAWRTSDNNYAAIHNGPVYTRAQMNRLEAEQQALDSVVQSLLSNNIPGDPDLPGAPDLSDVVEISVTSFNLRSPGLNSSNAAIADVIESTDYATIMATINNVGAHQSTNWDEGLQHALEIVNAWKQREPDEQVYVIFLTDGEPTANRNTKSGYTTDYWTHWNYADESAKAIVNAGYEFYSIFTYGTDNTFINYLNNLTRSANGVGSYTQSNFGNTNTYHDNFFNATDTSELVEAFNAIVDRINNALGLAGVSINDGIALDVTHTALTTSVGGTINGVTYSKTGGKTDSFTVTVGSDGRPVYTVSGSTSNGMTTSVNYDKIVEGSNPVTTTSANATVYTAGGGTYLMPMATLDGRELTWDLAPLGMLEDGATYTISFIVWPDQEAYDYVANLNNDISGYSWNESTQQPVYASDGSTVLYYRNGVPGMENIVKYPSGTYAALTNTHQDLNYYVYENEEHSDGTTETTYTKGDPINLPVPNPMRLETSGAKITKKWNADLQMVQLARLLYDTETGNSKNISLEFNVKQDNEEYKTVALGWNGSAYNWADELINVEDNGNTFQIGTMWQEEFALATGIMLSAEKMAARGLDTSKYPSGTYNGTTYYLLEQGHTYEVKESNLESYIFDFEPMSYHPMLVDGQLMNTTFTVSGNALTITDSKEMNDGIRIDNTLRGGINLKKIVTETINGVSQEINSNEKFEFTITLNNDAAPFSGNQIPWYGVNGKYYHDADGNYIADSVTGDTDSDGLADDGNILMPGDDGKTASATLKITDSDSLRIANVPAGTTYTVTETSKSGYELVKIDKQIVIDGETEESETRTSGYVMDGEIVPNRENNITFTNDTKSYEVKLRKVNEDNTRLSGAKFSVYSDEACTVIAKNKNGMEIGEVTSSAAGDVLIGALVPGTYYLKETAAPTDYEAITAVLPFTLTRNADDSVTVTSGNSVLSIEVVSGVNVLVVKNTHEKDNLKVSKMVVSDKAADADVPFTFTVKLGDTSISKSYTGTKTDKDGAESTINVTFAEGVATVTLKGGETINIPGLPTSVSYTVTEADADGFKLTGKTGDTGTITTTKSEAAFTNTRETGELEISKTVVSDKAADADVPFTFTVTLGDTSISKSYTGTKTDKDGAESTITVTFANGVATVILKDGEKVNIPACRPR